MKKEDIKNILYPYTLITADNYKYLVDTESMKNLGHTFALGFSFYDLKTGELLKNPKKSKVEDIAEAWSYDLLSEMPGNEISKNKIKKGDYLVRDNKIYTVMLDHYFNQITDDNFNNYYIK